MFDKNSYVYYSLKEIEKFDSKVSYTNQLKNLYSDIKEQIWNKNNHHTKIILTYPINKYIDYNNQYLEVMTQLHNKEYVTMNELYIYKWNITFTIDKINRFYENIISELLPLQERFSFENGNFIIDDKILFWWLKNDEKIKDLIYLIYKWILKYNKLKFTYQELKEIFLEYEKDYLYLNWEKCLNQKSKYDNLKNQLQDISKKEYKKDFEIELNRLLDSKFNLNFFNSSLCKDKYKSNFWIKKGYNRIAYLS